MTIAIDLPETAEQFATLLQHLQAGEEILLAHCSSAVTIRVHFKSCSSH